MPDMKDLDLNISLSTGATGDIATDDDFSDLLSTVITATESGDPAPKHHDVTIPVPNKTEITAEQYNRAKEQLIRSLKESADLLAELDKLPIVEGTELSLEEQQAAFTEAVELDAICRSYMTGPYFEAAGSKKKDEIVIAVKSIKQSSKTTRTDRYGLEVFKLMPEDVKTSITLSTNPLIVIFGTILNTAVKTVGKAINKNLIKKVFLSHLKTNPTIKAKMWQMIGSFYAKKDELSDALKYYGDMFKDQLSENDLKLDAIKLKVNFVTNQRNFSGYCYLLVVTDGTEKLADIDIDVDESDGKK